MSRGSCIQPWPSSDGHALSPSGPASLPSDGHALSPSGRASLPVGSDTSDSPGVSIRSPGLAIGAGATAASGGLCCRSCAA